MNRSAVVIVVPGLQIVQPELSAGDVDERGDQPALQRAGGVDDLRADRHGHGEFAVAGAGAHADLGEQLGQRRRRRFASASRMPSARLQKS